MRLSSTITGLADLVWPRRCMACGARVGALLPSDPATAFCPVCADSLMPVVSPRCPRCALPFEGAGTDHLCGECLRDPPMFTAGAALFQYGEAAARAVTRLKYGPTPHLAEVMGRLMLANTALGAVDLVVPVPLHRKRLRRRGFNQSALLARPMAKGLGVPLDGRLAVRTRDTTSQAGLTRDERRKNLNGAFAVQKPGRAAGRRILLVDDVVTTGTTVREVAKCLRRAGARDVFVAAFARAC